MKTFQEIDALREKHGITRLALYARANVHKETWRRTQQKTTTPNVKTLQRLAAALDAIIAEQERAA